MSELSCFIDSHCKDFVVHIEPVECNTVFIEIIHNRTMHFNNIEVAPGGELTALAMLVHEYQQMIEGFYIGNETIN